MCGSQYCLGKQNFGEVLNQTIGSAHPNRYYFHLLSILYRYHIKMAEHHGIVWYYFMDKTLLASWYRKCASYTGQSWNMFFCPLFWGSVFQTPNKIQTLINTKYSCSILKHAKKERKFIPGKVNSKPQKGTSHHFAVFLLAANFIEVYISLMHPKTVFAFYHDYIPKLQWKHWIAIPRESRLTQAFENLFVHPRKQ